MHTHQQEAPPPQQPPQVHPQPQVHQQQEIPSSFYTHFDASMSQIYRRLDQQQEESRRSFEAINTRMDRMDDQLSFLCYSNQMVNKTMYYPYQNTARQFREMEAQGVPVTIANLAIHRHREEEMNRERMSHNQTVQEAAAERAREENKGKTREVAPDSEEEESEEMYSSPLDEWIQYTCRLSHHACLDAYAWLHWMRTHRLQQWPSRFCCDLFVHLALSGHFRSELRLLNPETLKRTHQGIVRNGKQFKT
ncbi:hypothetical protein PIB30_014849 [Stylosanthes scabra]|uniref:Uncharacterized protein n=1 Tax=Stylosanthes scabra TaxID=79078 RepID=A0ABU6S6J2_9FABA|nr:hypothetical protein [Stylosanthes scabra]